MKLFFSFANVEEKNILLGSIDDSYTQYDIERHEHFSSMYKNNQKIFAICCWHMNQHESAAMWKLYIKSNEGVAIQSTFAKLKNSFIDPRIVFLGKVKYIDYDNSFLNPGFFSPFLHKRKSFEYEKEIRALHCITNILNPDYKANIDNPDWIDSIEGVEIEIDINKLIENIYISPMAPIWFADLVEKVILKYEFEFKVNQSKLNEDPLF